MQFSMVRSIIFCSVVWGACLFMLFYCFKLVHTVVFMFTGALEEGAGLRCRVKAGFRGSYNLMSGVVSFSYS